MTHRRKSGGKFVSGVLALLALFALLASGGCGGGGGDAPDGPNGPEAPEERLGSIIGTPHGDLAPYLEEGLGLVSTPLDGIGAAEELGDVVLLSVPVGLTASNAHLGLLAGALAQGKAVAVEHVNKAEVEVLLDALGLDISAPEAEGSETFELFAARRVGGDYHLFVTLDDEDAPETGTAEDEAVQRDRVENFAAWVGETKAKLKASAEVSNDGPAELTKIASAYKPSFDASSKKGNFMINYTIYSCHDFSEDADYYYIEQFAKLHPRTSVRSYLFENLWGDQNNSRDVGLDPDVATPLYSSSPENANDERSVTSGVEHSIGVSVGFEGFTPAGSVSYGVAFSNSKTFNLKDWRVVNRSAPPGRLKHMAIWNYNFLKDATAGAQLFQPIHNWLWIVPRKFSVGSRNGLHFRSDCHAYFFDSEDHHFKRLWVPVNIPPLLGITPGQMRFDAGKSEQTIKLSSARAWTASVDEKGKGWLSVSKESGDPTLGEGDMKELYVIVQANKSPDFREGTVTFRCVEEAGPDGKDEKAWEQKLEVHQAGK